MSPLSEAVSLGKKGENKMDLPEGYKRFKEYADMNCRGVYLTPKEFGLLEACMLLEDMSLALEYIARGPRPDDSDKIVAEKALQKFLEWK